MAGSDRSSGKLRPEHLVGSPPGGSPDASEAVAIARKDRAFHRTQARYYDHGVTQIYSIYHQWDLQPWILHLVRRFPRGRVLDLGAGTGAVSLRLASAALRVFAIDHSREMLSVARDKARSAGVPLDLALGDVLHLPFAPESFDAVTMQGILHHVPTALASLMGEAFRVLRPGGRFYISEPCDPPSMLGRLFRRLAILRPPDPTQGETDERPVDGARLSDLLTASGMRFRVRFLTHIPSAHFHDRLPPSVRIVLTRLLSLPFRTGDLLFVHGVKPERHFPPSVSLGKSPGPPA